MAQPPLQGGTRRLWALLRRCTLAGDAATASARSHARAQPPALVLWRSTRAGSRHRARSAHQARWRAAKHIRSRNPNPPSAGPPTRCRAAANRKAGAPGPPLRNLYPHPAHRQGARSSPAPKGMSGSAPSLLAFMHRLLWLHAGMAAQLGMNAAGRVMGMRRLQPQTGSVATPGARPQQSRRRRH